MIGLPSRLEIDDFTTGFQFYRARLSYLAAPLVNYRCQLPV